MIDEGGVTGRQQIRRRWRYYRTPAGTYPVREFLRGLPVFERAEVLADMHEVREVGRPAARHLRRDIYEVRTRVANRQYRVLFSAEGGKGRILLGLVGFRKEHWRHPEQLALALARLADWRARGGQR